MQPNQPQQTTQMASSSSHSIAQPRARVTLLSASRRSSMLTENERVAAMLPRIHANDAVPSSMPHAFVAKMTSPPSAGRRAAAAAVAAAAAARSPASQQQHLLTRAGSGASISVGSPTSPHSGASMSSESAGSTTAPSMASSRYNSYSSANPPAHSTTPTGANMGAAAAAQAQALAHAIAANTPGAQSRVLPVLVGGGSGPVSPPVTSPSSGNGSHVHAYPGGHGFGYRSGAVSPPPGQPSAVVARFHATNNSSFRRVVRHSANAAVSAVAFPAQQQQAPEQQAAAVAQPQADREQQSFQPSSVPSSRARISIVTSPPSNGAEEPIQTVPFVPVASATGAEVVPAPAPAAAAAAASAVRPHTPAHRRSFSAAVSVSSSSVVASATASASATMTASAQGSDSPSRGSTMVSPTSFAAANLYSDDNPDFIAYKLRWESMRDAQTALRRAGGYKDGRSLLSPVGSRVTTRASSPFSSGRSMSASPATMNLPSNSLSPPSHSRAMCGDVAAGVDDAAPSISVHIDSVAGGAGCPDGSSPFAPAPMSPMFADGSEIPTPCSATSPGPYVHAGSAFAILVESNRNSPLPPSPVPGFLTYSPSGSKLASPSGGTPLQEPASPASLSMPPSVMATLGITSPTNGVTPRVMSGAHARSRSFGQAHSQWPGGALSPPHVGSSAITRGLHSRSHSRSHSRGGSVASIPGPVLPPPSLSQSLVQQSAIGSAVSLSFPAGGVFAVPTAVATAGAGAAPSGPPVVANWRKMVERVEEDPVTTPSAPVPFEKQSPPAELRKIVAPLVVQRKELAVIRPPSATAAASAPVAIAPAVVPAPLLPPRGASPSPLQSNRSRIAIIPATATQSLVSPSSAGSRRTSRRTTLATAAAASLQQSMAPLVAVAPPSAVNAPFLPRPTRA